MTSVEIPFGALLRPRSLCLCTIRRPVSPTFLHIGIPGPCLLNCVSQYALLHCCGVAGGPLLGVQCIVACGRAGGVREAPEGGKHGMLRSSCGKVRAVLHASGCFRASSAYNSRCMHVGSVFVLRRFCIVIETAKLLKHV